MPFSEQITECDGSTYIYSQYKKKIASKQPCMYYSMHAHASLVVYSQSVWVQVVTVHLSWYTKRQQYFECGIVKW